MPSQHFRLVALTASGNFYLGIHDNDFMFAPFEAELTASNYFDFEILLVIRGQLGWFFGQRINLFSHTDELFGDNESVNSDSTVNSINLNSYLDNFTPEEELIGPVNSQHTRQATLVPPFYYNSIPFKIYFPMFVRRNSLYEDAINDFKILTYLRSKLPQFDSHKHYKMLITVQDEQGEDHGGLTRNILQTLISSNPFQRLFSQLSCGGDLLHRLEPEMNFSYDLGILLGFMVFNKVTLAMPLVDSFYFRLADDKGLDLRQERSCYSSLQNLKAKYMHEENGRNFTFDPANLENDVNEFIQFKAFSEYSDAWDLVTSGFQSVLGNESLTGSYVKSALHPQLEISLDEWKRNTEYYNCNEESDVVKWFWSLLSESNEIRSKVLYFTFGLKNLAENGFNENRFVIQKISDEGNLLPIGHTCAFQLDLPDYETEEIFREKMMKALDHSDDGFHII